MTPCLICHGSGRHYDDMEREWTNEPCRTCHGVGMVDLEPERERKPVDPLLVNQPRRQRIAAFRPWEPTDRTQRNGRPWEKAEAAIVLVPDLTHRQAAEALRKAGYHRTRSAVGRYRWNMRAEE